VSIRFLADEDLRAEIVQGVRSREPGIDILDVKTAGLRGAKDPVLLEFAAQQGRITISHDSETMIQHFWERVDAGKTAPGLFIVQQERSVIGRVIDLLVLVWAASEQEEWHNRVVYLPFR
jgi:hypothetical protein